MDDTTDKETAIELLQQLGLKEYEAKCFVALSRLPQGTAKDISDISEVPRTRVYDAVRVLESKGLVEIQHSNPQQFRAVSIDEAVETVRAEYQTRTERLRESLRRVDSASTDDESEGDCEVWAMSGTNGIDSRTEKLVESAQEEVLLFVCHERAITDPLTDLLADARDRGVTVHVGAGTDDVQGQLRDSLPDGTIFSSEAEWLHPDGRDRSDPNVCRLLMIDRETILTSTLVDDGKHLKEERAVIGRGFDNCFVTVIRNVMTATLPPIDETDYY